jgi:hypothetical protein
MVGRILMLAIVIALGYWYWTGPYQERSNPTYEQKLRQNARAMSDCIARKHYADTRMVSSGGDLEERCMRELKLYEEDGQWHSYDDVREDR